MANADVILDAVSLVGLEKQILKTARVLDELKKRLILSMPARYGSDLWWEREEILADEEISRGRVKKFKNADALIVHLDKLTS